MNARLQETWTRLLRAPRRTPTALARGALLRTPVATLLTVTGFAVATAVLAGALLVGHSVRAGLAEAARQRVGPFRYAIPLEGRFLAERVAERVSAATGAPACGVLALQGLLTARHRDADGRTLRDVRIYGVGPDFGVPVPGLPVLAPDEAAVNERVALELGLVPGSRVALQLPRPWKLPGDAPLAHRRPDRNLRAEFVVKAVLAADQMANLGLLHGQDHPRNLFVGRARLQALTGQAGQINLVLAGAVPGAADGAAALRAALTNGWSLVDAGYDVRARPGRAAVLMAPLVYMDGAVAGAVGVVPGVDAVMSYYLADRLQATGSEATGEVSYAFVAAASAGAGGDPEKFPAEDEIVLSEAVARRIGAATGTVVSVQCRVQEDAGTYRPVTRSLVVRAVRPVAWFEAWRDGMPAFPGLEAADRCADWDIGMPLDEGRLRDPWNERYWREHRATPVALVSLYTGMTLWSNRHGFVMSARLAGGSPGPVMNGLAQQAAPERLGVQVVPIAELAERAVGQAIDLGGLFLGMSFFLMVSALTVAGLLFAFMLDRQAAPAGLLRAIGWRDRQVAGFLFRQGAYCAVAGAALGCAIGVAYTWLLVECIRHFWPDVVVGFPFRLAPSPRVLALAFALGCAVTAATAGWVVRRHTRRGIVALLAGNVADAGHTGRGRSAWLGPVAWLSIGAGAGVHVAAVTGQIAPSPALFFVAGVLLLAGGLAGAASSLSDAGSLPLRSPYRLALANIRRRRSRSLGVVALFMCGIFLLTAVAVSQRDPAGAPGDRIGGTGGFRLWAETTVPVTEDLGSATSPAGRVLRAQGFPAAGRIVPLKMLEGDDAGCLNLNRAQRPRIYGADLAALDGLRAFEAHGFDWRTQLGKLGAGRRPRTLAGDADTLTWGLPAGTRVFAYPSPGGAREVEVAGSLPMRLSVFQGSLLMDREAFARAFPQVSGARAFLVDVPAGMEADAARALETALRRYGGEVQSTAQRLQNFGRVERAYLNVFLALGLLGLLLGTVGGGLVLARNVEERSTELALLSALGYMERSVRHLLLREHLLLLLPALAWGGFSAFLAAGVGTPGGDPGRPALLALMIVVLLGAGGMLALRLALRVVRPASPAQALRND